MWDPSSNFDNRKPKNNLLLSSQSRSFLMMIHLIPVISSLSYLDDDELPVVDRLSDGSQKNQPRKAFPHADSKGVARTNIRVL